MTDKQRQRLSDLITCAPDRIRIVDSDNRDLEVKDIIWSTRDYGGDKRSETEAIIVLVLSL